MKSSKGKVVTIPLAILTGITHKKLEERWLIALEALKKDLKNPDYQWVFEPIDLEKYSPTHYKVFNGQHRTEMHVQLGLKKIKGVIQRDYYFDLQSQREKKENWKFTKRHKCLNCNRLINLKKARIKKVNDIEKLCFYYCEAKNRLMVKDDLYRLNDCDKFAMVKEELVRV